MSEVRRVLLANGQYIEIVQETGSSTGSVMSQNAVTAALNGKANTTHTHAASDITSGTFGSARIADGAITKAKLAANAVTTAKVADGAITKAKLASEIITSMSSFEIVTINGVCTNGSPIKGKQLSIWGSIYEFDSTGVIKAAIPYGEVYTVKPKVANGYYSNDVYTYTASTASRSLTINYNLIATGVYIQNVDGQLYTIDEWDASNNQAANGIALINGFHNFMTAIDTTVVQRAMATSDNDWVDAYLTPCSGETEAKYDYDGLFKTNLLMQYSGVTASTAESYCANFVFPDGFSKGYLPSLGELHYINLNFTAFNNALVKCGGVTLLNGYFVPSSTYAYLGAYSPYDRYYWKYYFGSNSSYNKPQTTTISSSGRVIVCTTLS